MWPNEHGFSRDLGCPEEGEPLSSTKELRKNFLSHGSAQIVFGLADKVKTDMYYLLWCEIKEISNTNEKHPFLAS